MYIVQGWSVVQNFNKDATPEAFFRVGWVGTISRAGTQVAQRIGINGEVWGTWASSCSVPFLIWGICGCSPGHRVFGIGRLLVVLGKWGSLCSLLFAPIFKSKVGHTNKQASRVEAVAPGRDLETSRFLFQTHMRKITSTLRVVSYKISRVD